MSARVLERQGLHALAWVVLGALLYQVTGTSPGADEAIAGLSVRIWVASSWILAGLSQAWMAAFWRLELHGGAVSARLGDLGFPLLRAGYAVLFPLRFLPLIPISLATAGTGSLSPTTRITLVVASTPLILWTVRDALVHFGLDRLSGSDHFFPEDRGGRKETRGIHRYLANAMYTVGTLALFHPGLVTGSTLGLWVAAFHYAFVWVHYWCTEAPDLEILYGGR